MLSTAVRGRDVVLATTRLIFTLFRDSFEENILSANIQMIFAFFSIPLDDTFLCIYRHTPYLNSFVGAVGIAFVRQPSQK